MRQHALTVILLALALGACDATLISGVNETQANRMIAALHGASIAADKSQNGTDEHSFMVTVARDDLGQALAVVGGQGLPEAPNAGLAEVYADQGLVPSPSEDAAKLASALGGELARTMEAMEGVITARVHIAPTPPPNTRGQAESSRASVFIRSTPDTKIAPEKIQTLVAGATPRLQSADVEVIVEHASAHKNASVPPALTRVGPFSVSAASAGPLRATVAISLAFNVLAAMVLGWLLLRNRRNKAAM